MHMPKIFIPQDNKPFRKIYEFNTHLLSIHFVPCTVLAPQLQKGIGQGSCSQVRNSQMEDKTQLTDDIKHRIW